MNCSSSLLLARTLLSHTEHIFEACYTQSHHLLFQKCIGLMPLLQTSRVWLALLLVRLFCTGLSVFIFLLYLENENLKDNKVCKSTKHKHLYPTLGTQQTITYHFTGSHQISHWAMVHHPAHWKMTLWLLFLSILAIKRIFQQKMITPWSNAKEISECKSKK